MLSEPMTPDTRMSNFILYNYFLDVHMTLIYAYENHKKQRESIMHRCTVSVGMGTLRHLTGQLGSCGHPKNSYRERSWTP